MCARLHLQLLVICACAHIALFSENEVVRDGRAREKGPFQEPCLPEPCPTGSEARQRSEKREGRGKKDDEEGL